MAERKKIHVSFPVRLGENLSNHGPSKLLKLAGSTECQQLDWKSGHQTACTPMVQRQLPVTEEHFQFYEVPYVAHWAINLQNWKIKSNSKEHLGITLDVAVLSASPHANVG